MLGTATFLAFYYLGFGFLAFLGWACITDSSGRPVGPVPRRRLRRLSIALALVGVLHPALALAGRDLAAQLRDIDGPPDPNAAWTVRITGWAVVAALGLAALVVLSQLGPFEAVPGLQQIRAALPYSNGGDA